MKAFMEMPVCGPREHGKVYAQLSEQLVLDILQESNLDVESTDYKCPIDIKVQNKYGLEVKYRNTQHRTVVEFHADARRHKLKFCKDNKLKPITVLVEAIDSELVEITYKKGIKNIKSYTKGKSLEEFINAVVAEQSA